LPMPSRAEGREQDLLDVKLLEAARNLDQP